jgi:hypothetical protein
MYLRVEFHVGATAPGDGIKYVVDEYKTLTADFCDDDSGSTATIEFRGIGPGGVDKLIKGFNLETLKGATSTSELGTTWMFDVTGLVKVYFKITSITGVVGIIGRAVK